MDVAKNSLYSRHEHIKAQLLTIWGVCLYYVETVFDSSFMYSAVLIGQQKFIILFIHNSIKLFLSIVLNQCSFISNKIFFFSYFFQRLTNVITELGMPLDRPMKYWKCLLIPCITIEKLKLSSKSITQMVFC